MRNRNPTLLSLPMSLLLTLCLLTMATTTQAQCPAGGFIHCLDDNTYLTCGNQIVQCQGQKVCDPETPYLAQYSPCQYFGSKCHRHIC
ncbi:MAG: hypothetical protein J3Q66DRAFT_203151 [Benniella sp.]|nr:MAG: hypothetical protein J3Q66DRAFT_203151 [Benniella sp.]